MARPRVRAKVTDLEAKRASYAADLELARRCVDEEAARREVFRQHADAVFRLAWRLVSNRADAEDVLQESFIQVFASIHNFRGEASLRSWLHRVTVRTAGRYRRKVRRQREQLELVIDGMERPRGDLGQLVEDREALRRLWELLDRVVERRRVVFVLHEVEGYSLPEAAAILDISVTAAKKRVWRARRDLAKLATGDPVLGAFFETRTPTPNDNGEGANAVSDGEAKASTLRRLEQDERAQRASSTRRGRQCAAQSEAAPSGPSARKDERGEP